MTTIAETILAQLGGGKFIAMTGARNLTDTGNGLTLRLPRGVQQKINCVRVTLTPADLYRVEFISIRGANVRTVSEHDGVYADMLQRLFTDETGLYTTLGTMRG